MECVEAALKTSIRKEMAVKASPQAVFEDLWGLNGQSGVQNCEDFSVDDLLDFSNDDGFVEQRTMRLPSSSGSGSRRKMRKTTRAWFWLTNVPADDLENLEWLSHFVEDSFSGRTPVPAKARSKRTRTGGRVWSLGSPSFTESSSSSSSSSSTSSCPSSPWLIYNTTQGPGVFGSTVEKPQKKPKRSVAEGGSSQPPRRCSHCGVQKTPQWRTGPNGAKTLCNACGVRYKSGRLVPEYRPACSPTFSSELHSNHHRKVMEIRRKKEVPPVSEPGLVTTPVVRSF
ncbi:hypothetical protein M0R45_004060 [Rubus argutus]|uniref:GATA transcription factor n=1 Tax=Rubus argutus TaxID=59490 RepID=A0AAW1YHY4_RUBAR